MPAFPLPEADALEITTLVDNQVDALLPAEEQVRRNPWVRGVHNPLIDSPETMESLRAEHGFAALVTVTAGGERHRLLFDAGLSRHGLMENMDRLQLNPKELEAVVLSHGHFDHTGGLAGLAERLGRANLPLLVHPRAYTKRRSAPPNVSPLPLPPPSRSALEGAGFELVESEDPSLIFQDALLVTGEVPRVTGFEQGFPFFQAEENGQWEPEPHLLDDQAVVVNVRGRGLVVLTGCGHSGIVNIVRRAVELTGVESVAGVLGGFHLSGAYFDPLIPLTIDALRAFSPAMIVPGHCTGWRAQQAIAAAFPEAYVHNAVGTTFAF
ncbi:MAG: MBL fold metallo-hydrolase [Dehalococcoidia bacterium]|nr:MBL fold metallo-hydrolase [Dehalococcoidia bacterium]